MFAPPSRSRSSGRAIVTRVQFLLRAASVLAAAALCGRAGPARSARCRSAAALPRCIPGAAGVPRNPLRYPRVPGARKRIGHRHCRGECRRSRSSCRGGIADACPGDRVRVSAGSEPQAKRVNNCHRLRAARDVRIHAQTNVGGDAPAPRLDALNGPDAGDGARDQRASRQRHSHGNGQQDRVAAAVSRRAALGSAS